MNRFTILLILLFLSFGLHAQFVQSGRTMEYNGDNPKTNYPGVVDIHFNGASCVFEREGQFKLHFNQLSRGNVIGSFDIKAGNSNYVLFNKSSLQRWILTPDLNMEVLLCKKSKIDGLINTYTQNHVNRLERKYSSQISLLEDKIAKLKKEKEDISKENEDLRRLKDQYERELSLIKANAIIFAYVDETKLDSLERLKRECLLQGDIEGAIAIGREIDYSNISQNLIDNSRVSIQKNQESIDALFDLIGFVEQHVENLKSQNDSLKREVFTDYLMYNTSGIKKDEDIAQNLLIINNTYEYLIDLFTNYLRCEEHFLEDLRQKYADCLYEYTLYADISEEERDAILEKAIEYGGQYATYDKASNSTDFIEAKILYNKCIKVASDPKLKNIAIEDYESFPDFLYVTKDNDSIYCHILENNKDVVICDYHVSKNKRHLVIPAKVSWNKKLFNVRKIGAHSIRNVCWAKWKEMGSTKIPHSKEIIISRDIHSVVIPEGVESIGSSAFAFQFLDSINLPNSLKVIGNSAFTECSINNIEIPEGVEQIGSIAFWNYYVPHGDPQTVRLPSTLKIIDERSFVPDSLVELSISSLNPYFKLIDGLPYSSDSTYIINFLIPDNIERMWFSKYINPMDKRYTSWGNYLLGEYNTKKELKEYQVEEANPYCKAINGILYDKVTDKILAIPYKLNDICFPPLYSVNRIELDDYDRGKKNYWFDNSYSQIDKFKLFEMYFFYHWYDRRNSDFGFYSGSKKEKKTFEEIKREFIELLNNETFSYDTSIEKEQDWYITLDDFLDEGASFLKIDSLSDVGETILLRLDKQGKNNKALCFYYAKNNEFQKSLKYLATINENSENIIREVASNFWYGTDGFTKDSVAFYKWLHASAVTMNSSIAAYNLGEGYGNGYGVRLDLNVAKEWYRKAVEWGDSINAAYSLAFIFYKDNDFKDAYKYFNIASNHGECNSTNFIGTMYANGIYLRKDKTKSIEFYHKAYEQGDSLFAPLNLGICYQEDKAYDNSIRYYEIARKNGNPDALNALSYMYANGTGVPCDFSKAMRYIDEAIIISPQNANFYDSKGEILLMQGKHEEAFAVWKKVLELNPEFLKDYPDGTNLSNGLKRMGLIE